jgi:hypothetical protein
MSPAQKESNCMAEMSRDQVIARIEHLNSKRCDLITNYRCGSAIEEMEPADDGDWLRYEDVGPILDACLTLLRQQQEQQKEQDHSAALLPADPSAAVQAEALPTCCGEVHPDYENLRCILPRGHAEAHKTFRAEEGMPFIETFWDADEDDDDDVITRAFVAGFNAPKEIDHALARTLLSAVKALAAKGYRHLDDDEESKAMKVLSALAGVTGCYPEIDKLYAQIGSDTQATKEPAFTTRRSAAQKITP